MSATSNTGPASEPSLIVTTARRPTLELERRAQEWSVRLGVPAVPRAGLGVEALARAHGAIGVVVVEADRTIYLEPAIGLEYFFHPNLAAVRIRNIESGTGDHMVEAMGLQPGDHVLDCTLGRASDAIVCAWRVGERGRVVGIEKVPVIAYLTAEGLQRGQFVGKRFTRIMRRVEAFCADYNDYLPTCAEGSFDVVYFDPIFHDPVKQSTNMESLRAIADAEIPGPEALRQALRVARRCVVIKQRRGTPLWEQLNITEVHGGKHARVEYGVARPA